MWRLIAESGHPVFLVLPGSRAVFPGCFGPVPGRLGLAPLAWPLFQGQGEVERCVRTTYRFEESVCKLGQLGCAVDLFRTLGPAPQYLVGGRSATVLG